MADVAAEELADGDEGRVVRPEVPASESLPSQLNGAFGMCEMEHAALLVLRKAVRIRSWDIVVSLKDFPGHAEQVGFLNLLRYGWLEPNPQNPSAHGEFGLSEGFIDRVVKRCR